MAACSDEVGSFAAWTIFGVIITAVLFLTGVMDLLQPKSVAEQLD